jgi:hypothetical protein
VIDPDTFAEMPLETRERVAYQLVSDAAARAAEIIGPHHPRYEDLIASAELFDQRPALRPVEGAALPRPGVLQPPLLRLV